MLIRPDFFCSFLPVFPGAVRQKRKSRRNMSGRRENSRLCGNADAYMCNAINICRKNHASDFLWCLILRVQEVSKKRFCKLLKIRCHFVVKIQGTYFKISALYFKIYGLYFLRHALCFFSLRGSVEKMRGKMFCAMRLSLKNIVSNIPVSQVILM